MYLFNAKKNVFRCENSLRTLFCGQPLYELQNVLEHSQLATIKQVNNDMKLQIWFI
jgi:hypothetical protein